MKKEKIELPDYEKIKNIILEQYKEGKIVICNEDGLSCAPLKEIVKQPVDGLLYDINRNEMVILTFIHDKKWINDYASTQIIRELHSKIENIKGVLNKQYDNEETVTHIKNLLI